MMKKLILMVAAVVLTATAVEAQAQRPVTTSQQIAVTTSAELPVVQLPVLKNSVYAGVGLLPVTVLGSVFVNLFTAPFTALNGYSLDGNYNGAPKMPISFFAGYERNFSKLFSLGASFTYSSDKYGYKSNSLNLDPNKYMFMTTSWSTLMVTIKFNWVNKPAFRFYSRAGAGICIIGTSIKFADGTKPETSYFPIPFAGAQVSPLGFEFGRTFSFFVEPISVGWQSLFLTLGLKYNF